jgi:hypothetical protein
MDAPCQNTVILAKTLIQYTWHGEAVPYRFIKHMPRTGVLRIRKLGTIIVRTT